MKARSLASIFELKPITYFVRLAIKEMINEN
jgi:hypothetical protein